MNVRVSARLARGAGRGRVGVRGVARVVSSACRRAARRRAGRRRARAGRRVTTAACVALLLPAIASHYPPFVKVCGHAHAHANEKNRMQRCDEYG